MASPSKLPARPSQTSNRSARPLSMFEVPTDHMRRLQQIGEGGSGARNGRSTPESGQTSKQSKRRSLLPQFSSSRKASVDEKDNAASIREDTSESDAASLAESRDDRKSMAPPPKPRPMSMRPPSTGTTMGNKPSSHTKSASRDGFGLLSRPSSQRHTPATSISSQPATSAPPSATSTAASGGLKRAGSTRLSQAQTPGTRLTSQNTSRPRGSSSSTVTSTAQKRSSAIISNPPALNTALAASGQVQAELKSPTRAVTRSQMAMPKPAFNTYQQHYSPAKSALPKPGLPASRSSRPGTSSGEGEEISLEVALEQIELLQLSLLHQASAKTTRSYEASARHKLGRMHAKLQKEYEAIQAHEQENRRLTNLAALETWCPDPALLAEHLQILSRVVSDLRGMTDPASRYAEVVHAFDEWATYAEAVLLHEGAPAGFIEALPESWRSVHTSQALKLRGIQRDLAMLPPLPPTDNAADPSSLEIMVESCAALVEGMLKELDVMTRLQKEVLQQSKARIDEQIEALVASSESYDKDSWVPAWRNVSC